MGRPGGAGPAAPSLHRRLAALVRAVGGLRIGPMDGTSHVTDRGEILRLLRYSRPYAGLLALGILLMALMAIIEGLVAFSLKPALDIVLNPHSALQTLALFTIPFTNRTITLNSFVPHRIHNVWNVFAISIVLMFLIKGAAEYFG